MSDNSLAVELAERADVLLAAGIEPAAGTLERLADLDPAAYAALAERRTALAEARALRDGWGDLLDGPPRTGAAALLERLARIVRWD